MIAVVNHHSQIGADLSLRVGGEFHRCHVKPAGISRQAFTQPSVAYATQALINAINALDATDPRRIALTSFELVDLGEVQFNGAYTANAQALLATARAPRKTVIVVGVQEYGRG